jgi:hypothetical protein
MSPDSKGRIPLPLPCPARFQNVIEQSHVVPLFIAEIDEAELQISVSLRLFTVLPQQCFVPVEREFVVADYDTVKMLTV